jgi:hypothetical protein
MAWISGRTCSGSSSEVSSALASLSGKPASTHTREALIEASNIIAGVIDADGRQADAELTRTRRDRPKLDPPVRDVVPAA